MEERATGLGPWPHAHGHSAFSFLSPIIPGLLPGPVNGRKEQTKKKTIRSLSSE